MNVNEKCTNILVDSINTSLKKLLKKYCMVTLFG